MGVKFGRYKDIKQIVYETLVHMGIEDVIYEVLTLVVAEEITERVIDYLRDQHD